jgi:uncharacterized protein
LTDHHIARIFLSVSRKEKFIELIRRDSTRIRKHGVREIGLFGSAVKEEDGPGSDYDILVVFEQNQKTFQNFVDLVDLLETELGDSVDLVTPEGLSPHIGPRILKEVEYVPLAP